MKSGTAKSRFFNNTPLRLLVVATVCVFVAEALIMVFLSNFPSLSIWTTIFIDAILIVVFALPVLYLTFFRKFQQSVSLLKQSEERFRRLFQLAPLSYQSLDEKGNFIEVNDSWCQTLGYSREEVIGRNFVEFIDPGFSDIFQRCFPIFKNAGSINGVEHTMIKKDGSRIIASFAGRVGYNDNGSFKQTHCIFVDITERKQAEEANARLSRAIEQADESIIITDADSTIQYVNPAFEKTTGYTAKEAIGQTPRILKSGQQDDIFYKSMWETLLSNKEWRGEFINKKKDGTLFVENAVISPVRDSQGKTVNYVAVKHDITEVKRLRALKSRAERLELAGTIAGQVAHDFNNLLAPLMAYPEFIREELPHDHHAQAYLDAIEEATRKIVDINQDLLTMGRRGHYTQEILDLNRIVLQAIQEMKLRTKTITVETNLCENLMKIKGGGAQIYRMLTNLLVNAQDAMQDVGRVTIKSENFYADNTLIAYDCVPKGEYVKLTIIDNGCGIPDDIIQKIFDPFFTTKSADKKRGSGLGLSVVNAVMKDHNGYIDLSSKIGKGTSIYLYFPVTREDTGDSASKHYAGGTERILVVDDDDIQREVTLLLLRKLGYKVSSVKSGEKAIEFLRENPQDLVILDMVMQDGIDGTETYRRILKINPCQKAIILSGFSESEQVIEAQKLGAGPFVKKPITRRIIAAAVRTEIDRPVEVVSS